MTTKKLVGLRLHEKTIEKLKELADEEHRSVNNLLEVIIDKYIKEAEQNRQL